MGEVIEDRGKYKIIKKSYDGVQLEGMVIEDKEGRTKMVSMEDMIKLARASKLSNGTYIKDSKSGEYKLKVDGGLGSLDTTYKSSNLALSLTDRMIDANGDCVGYKARGENGKSYKLSINKTWELAFNHAIKGVKATIVNNKKCLMSVGENSLETLPKIKKLEK